MNNKEVAELLRDVAAAYEILGEDFFKIRAYKNAADAVEQLSSEIKDIYDQGKLQSVPGIGANIAGHLNELFKTGKVVHFEKILNKLPKSLYKVLKLPGIGPKTASKLTLKLKLSNPDTVYQDLLKAAAKNEIAKLEGFGEKSQKELVDSIKRVLQKNLKKERMLLPYADSIAKRAMFYMRNCKEALIIEPLGSLRRKVSTVGDIDIAVATENSKAVIDHFASWGEKKKLLAAGINTARLIHTSGAQIDIKTQKAARYGALLQHFTGSKEHNIALREYAQKRGLSLSEHGIKNVRRQMSNVASYSSEEQFYNALGMDWIPPELRENTGEIEAALKHKLPNLVQLDNIKGDLHIHSDFDLTPSHDLGVDGAESIIQKAIDLGYEYIGFSDHNPASKLANSKKIDLIIKRNNYIDKAINKFKGKVKLRVFKMLEVDILADGSLPIPNKVIKNLDGLIVAIHSSFRQTKEAMTKRILSGLSHRKAKIFAHPTGRLLNSREGVEADWERIFSFCKSAKKALEINAYPNRLDLPDSMIPDAAKIGVKFILGSDAHSVEGMDTIGYAVSVAKRGWLEKKDIINCLSVVEFKQWLLS